MTYKMRNIQRKCMKCGSSPAEDPNVVLYRFPKPGPRNISRCESWAIFCFPNEAWYSTEFQSRLYAEYRMLCDKHFAPSSFVDLNTKKIYKFAEPVQETEAKVECSPLNVSPHEVKSYKRK